MSALSSIASVGFGFRERMAGTYRGLAPGLDDGGFSFEFEVRCDDLAGAVRDVVGTMEGRVTMDGLADDAPAKGTIAISPLWKRRIGYRFSFAGTDGRRYAFAGSKHLRILSPVRSWTTLEGTVRDEGSGDVVAEVVARFDLREDLFGLILSFRPALGRWS